MIRKTNQPAGRGSRAKPCDRDKRSDACGAIVLLRKGLVARPDAQHVSLSQRPALETAEAAQDVRGRASEKRLHRDSALHAKITARSRSRGTQAKRLARPHLHRRAHIDACIIERRAEIGTGQRDDCSFAEK